MLCKKCQGHKLRYNQRRPKLTRKQKDDDGDWKRTDFATKCKCGFEGVK